MKGHFSKLNFKNESLGIIVVHFGDETRTAKCLNSLIKASITTQEFYTKYSNFNFNC